MLPELMSEKERKKRTDEELLELAHEEGVFLNEHTLEVDLFRAGLGPEFEVAMTSISKSKRRRLRMAGWAAAPETLDADRLLRDIDGEAKGRFAQRLASAVAASNTEKVPDYIRSGIDFIARAVGGG
jgi:putative ATP-dependent endonuclease of OLD family